MKSKSIQDRLNLMPHWSPTATTTTTRTWISTLRTRKLRCQMQLNWPNSSAEQRLYLAAPRWARMRKEENARLKEGGNKNASTTSDSTYNPLSEASESNMPGGSSVRPLSKRILKPTRNETDQVFRAGSISCLIAYHHH